MRTKRSFKVLNKQNSTEVRDKILKVSRQLFVQKGYKGASIREIATASETNIAMVNYYFRSKEKLFEAIFEESFNILSEKILFTLDSDLSFFEIIRKWVYSYYDVLTEFPQLPIFILNEVNQNPHTLVERLKLKNPYQVYAKLAIRINEEEQKGTIRNTPVPDLLLNIVSLSIFPFVSAPVVTQFLSLPANQYKELLASHKEYVVEFIINALKK